MLCGKELAGQLGGYDDILEGSVGDKDDHLYDLPYREPKWEFMKVFQEETFLPDQPCGDEICICGIKLGC